MKKILISLLIIMFVSANKVYCDDNIFIKSGSREKKVIALSFDDGPHPTETLEVLEVLKKYNVKATFFVAGKHANWYKEPLLRAVSENHEIGNHTFSHLDITNLSSSQIEKEILDCEKVLLDLGIKKPVLFRPPFGLYNKERLENIAKKHNYKIVLWANFDVMDWKNPSPEEIAQTVVDKAQNGDIILLHDYGTTSTVKALDIFIPQMIEKGFEFKTVSDLLQDN